MNANRLTQGTKLAKTMKPVGLQDKAESKTKGSCVCAPTSHVGSFRCRLHRVSAPKKSSLLVRDNNGPSLHFDSKSMKAMDHKPSRFCRESTATVQLILPTSSLKSELYSNSFWMA